MAQAMKQKFVVWGVAAAGLLVLGAAAYWWQHRPSAAANVAGGAAVADAAASGAGPSGAKAGARAEAIVVEAAPVKPADLVDDVQAVGSILANEAVVLRPEISGRVAQIRFTEGQRVRRGDALIQLDDSVPRAELAQAEAQLALARSNFDRTRDLAKQGFVSESAQDQTASALKVQDAARVLAQTKLEKSTKIGRAHV